MSIKQALAEARKLRPASQGGHLEASIGAELARHPGLSLARLSLRTGATNDDVREALATLKASSMITETVEHGYLVYRNVANR